MVELVSKELNHIGVIAEIFRQIGGHSSRFVQWPLKKSKSWGLFWSYQLNSSVNPTHLPQKWVKFAGLAMVLNGSFKRTPGKILNPAFVGNFCRMPSLVSKYFKLDIPFLVVYLLIWLFVMKRTNHRTLQLHFGLWAEEISKEEKKIKLSRYLKKVNTVQNRILRLLHNFELSYGNSSQTSCKLGDLLFPLCAHYIALVKDLQLWPRATEEISSNSSTLDH